jgi:dihydroorotate dehydrogenase electron transfer subunit
MSPLALQVTEIATSAGQLSVRCAGGPEHLGAPGQFYLASASVPDPPFLRAPLFPFSTHTGRWEFLVDAAHPFARLQPGDPVDLIGPLGRGFELPPRAARLLLIARSPERLLPLMHWALARQWPVALLFTDGAPEPSLADLPLAVEVERGPLTAELAAWAEVVALDVADAEAGAEHARSLCPPRPESFVQALITPTMPCGVGACQACWVDTPHGRRLACLEGPVMAL